jgi:dephospho-CoA kinase
MTDETPNTKAATTPTNASAPPPLRGPLKGYIPPDERIIFRTKPSPLFVLLVPLRTLFVLAALWMLGSWAFSLLAGAQNDLLRQIAARGRWLSPIVAGLVAFRLFWQSFEWLARLYVMTDRRVIRVSGVLTQRAIDVPLTRIQNITVSRSIRERLFGLGTLGFATAGTAWTELAWVMIPNPQIALTVTRDTIAAAASLRPSASEPAQPTDEMPTESKRPLVIGIVGGIASGKSTVAQAFADLGCVVGDSDLHAREALAQPDVRKQLIEWWGDDILNTQGDPDRTKIAAIVFRDPAQRARLEALIHPLVHARRARQIAESTDAPAFIIDAPLLLEAGVDKECDAVVFVETPRDVRLKRAKENRGWDEQEFTRREKAQLDLKAKRARADHIIPNTDDRATLARRCKDLLERIRATPRPGKAYRSQQQASDA